MSRTSWAQSAPTVHPWVGKSGAHKVTVIQGSTAIGGGRAYSAGTLLIQYNTESDAGGHTIVVSPSGYDDFLALITEAKEHMP